MLVHVHTFPFTFTPHRPNAGTADPAFGDHTRLIPRSQSRSTIIHVHTSSFTFTTRRPNAGTADPAFRDHTRLGSRLQFRDMTIRVHTSSLTFTPCQPDAGTADPAFGDHTRLRLRLQPPTFSHLLTPSRPFSRLPPCLYPMVAGTRGALAQTCTHAAPRGRGRSHAAHRGGPGGGDRAIRVP